jgi:adhesin/invasin
VRATRFSVAAIVSFFAACSGDTTNGDDPLVPETPDARVAPDAGAADAAVAPDAAPVPDAAPPPPDAPVPPEPSGYLLTADDTRPPPGATVLVTAQLVDSDGEPVALAGRAVSWVVQGGGSLSATRSFTDLEGAARVSLRAASIAGTTHTVTASDGTFSGTSPAIVVGAAPGPAASFAFDPPRLVADGMSTTTITIRAGDGATGALELRSTIGFLGALSANGDGSWTAVLRSSTRSGVAVLTAFLDGVPLEPRAEVPFDPGPPDSFAVGAALTSVPPGGRVAISAHLVDVNGNLITEAGHEIVWSVNGGGGLAPETGVTDSAGLATTTLTVSSVSGTVHVVTAKDSVPHEGKSPPITVE